METMQKSITVRVETWQKLTILKAQMKALTMNEVIEALLEIRNGDEQA